MNSQISLLSTRKKPSGFLNSVYEMAHTPASSLSCAAWDGLNGV